MEKDKWFGPPFVCSMLSLRPACSPPISSPPLPAYDIEGRSDNRLRLIEIALRFEHMVLRRVTTTWNRTELGR